MHQYLYIAGPGINDFGLFKLLILTYPRPPRPPRPPSPEGFKGVLAIGRKTGFIAGWKLYANFLESIPFLLLFYRTCGGLYELYFFLYSPSSFFMNLQSYFSICLYGSPCFN